MSDSFEFTLHSPLTKEDWNKISDAEHENTTYVTFQTPQGRQVKYIRCEVIDMIKAEIEQLPTNYIEVQRPHSTVERYVVELDAVLRVLNKYRAESEEV